MSISNTNTFPKDVVILQRDDTNTYYGETHISGTEVIMYIDSAGHLNADRSASFYSTFPPPSSGLIPGNTYPITSSWAESASVAISASYAPGSPSVSASYADTASWAPFQVSASWASRSFDATSASFASQSFSSSYASFASQSFASTTASFASQSFSASYASFASQSFGATSASFASRSFSASYASFASQSFASTTASFASRSFSSSFAESASWAPFQVSASWASRSFDATSASFATSASWSPGSGTSTSASWASRSFDATSASFASRSFSASYAESASYAPGSPSVSASYAETASWTPTEGRVVVLCTSYTPTVTGSDAAEIPMPYNPYDGITPVSWSVSRINFRTQTPESVSSSIIIEKSISTGLFNAISLGTLTLSGSLYETYTSSVGEISSGNKMRFNVNELGTATNWTVTVEVKRI